MLESAYQIKQFPISKLLMHMSLEVTATSLDHSRAGLSHGTRDRRAVSQRLSSNTEQLIRQQVPAVVSNDWVPQQELLQRQGTRVPLQNEHAGISWLDQVGGQTCSFQLAWKSPEQTG